MEGELFKKIVSRMQNAFAYYKIIYDSLGFGIDYEFVYINKAFQELTGLKKEIVIGKKASDFLDNQFIDLKYLPIFTSVAKNGTEDKIEEYFEVWKRWYSIDVFSPEEGYFGLLYTDITDIKNLTSWLSEQKEIIRQITENLEEITFLMDVETKSVIYASTSAEKITGIPIERFYNEYRLWASCIYKDDFERTIQKLKMDRLIEHFKENTSYIDEFRILDCYNNIKWVRLKCMPVRDEYNKIVRLVGIIQDITKEKKDKIEIMKAKNKAEKLAMFDYLTNTYNRRAFFIRAKEEYSRAKRQNKPISIILTDLDKFKLINDTYGHDVGDLVLKNFSRKIKELVRKYDVVARFGGEEFVIMLSGAELNDAYKKAEELRRKIEESYLYCKKINKYIRYTASFGVATVDPNEKFSLEETITKADMALYKAKNSGRNRVECI